MCERSGIVFLNERNLNKMDEMDGTEGRWGAALVRKSKNGENAEKAVLRWRGHKAGSERKFRAYRIFRSESNFVTTRLSSWS